MPGFDWLGSAILIMALSPGFPLGFIMRRAVLGFGLLDTRKTLGSFSMNLIKPMVVYLIFGALLAIGMAKAVTGAPLILLVVVAIYTGLFIKYGCLGH